MMQLQHVQSTEGNVVVSMVRAFDLVYRKEQNQSHSLSTFSHCVERCPLDKEREMLTFLIKMQ